MNCWLVPPLNRFLAPLLSLLCLSGLIILPTTIQADDGIRLRPLRPILPTKLASLLPSDTHVLIDRSAIEEFLVALEGAPPDWATVYGHGHHDPGYDERLFNLNRERDAAREGNPVLNWYVAFVWPGELSQFDPETKSYTVAVSLAKNPKTPVATSMNILPRLMEKDLRMISIDRNVPDVLRTAARRKMVMEK